MQLVGVVERQVFAAATWVARLENPSLVEAPERSCPPIYDDITTFDGRWLAGCVDLVTAGIPCTPHSLAGKRLGVDDDRWIWNHVFRIYREVGARLLFVECVPGLLSTGGFPAILASLASCGLAAEWLCLSAAAVGAPHKRDRFFLLAVAPADAGGIALRGQLAERDQPHAALGGDAQPDDDGAHRPPADADGEGRQQLGIGGVLEGEWQALGHDADGRGGADAADAVREQRALGWREPGDDGEELEAVAGGDVRRGCEEAAESSLRRADAGSLSWVDQHPWLAGEPATFDGTGELNDDWAERIHALGNSVSPPQAAAAWRELWGRLFGGAA
jgi:DNA (cytosine-5)-methyltransferase 1